MEVTQDTASLLPPGDFAKLDKRQREEFHAMQERMIAYLVKESNQFSLQFPQLKVDWRFQAEVYSSPHEQPSAVRYSSRVY